MKLIQLTKRASNGAEAVFWLNPETIEALWLSTTGTSINLATETLEVTESPEQIAAMIEGDKANSEWFASLLRGKVIKYDPAVDLPDDETVSRIIAESVNLWRACKARREATRGETDDGAKVTIPAEEWRAREIAERVILDRIEGH